MSLRVLRPRCLGIQPPRPRHTERSKRSKGVGLSKTNGREQKNPTALTFKKNSKGVERPSASLKRKKW